MEEGNMVHIWERAKVQGRNVKQVAGVGGQKRRNAANHLFFPHGNRPKVIPAFAGGIGQKAAMDVLLPAGIHNAVPIKPDDGMHCARFNPVLDMVVADG